MAAIAADIMTSPAITVSPEASLAEIAAVLSSRHISAVPVCTADNTLVGIVSEGDVLKPFRESVRKQRDWWLGMVAEGEELSQDFLEYLRQTRHTAADVMIHDIVTADERTSLPQLAELMTQHAVKRLPILRDGHVVGIVSRADLVAAIARAPDLLA